MSNRVIWTIIALMTLSLIGLTSFQVYWINNAIKLSNERFNKDVHESLNRVAHKLEKNELVEVAFSVASKDTAITVIADSGNKNDFIFIDEGVEVIIDSSNKTTREWITKSNSEFHTKEFGNSLQHFTDSSNGFRIEVIATSDSNGYDLNVKKVLQKTSEFNTVIHEMVTKETNVSARINPETIDSLLKVEFENKGIDIYFNFGVFDNNSNHFVFIDTAKMAQEPLINSPLKATLFPNDILENAMFLVVNFPTKDQFLFKKIFATLSSSIVLLLIIITCFSYAIFIILKQKKISELKSDFINNMTHEFKTPIATVSLASEALSDPDIAKQKVNVTKYLGVIKDETKRLEVQVERVLQAATMEKGELSINKTKVDIHQLLNDCIEKANIQIDAKNGSITSKLNATKYFSFIDGHHFYNAITNLLDNAIKYTDKAPKIHISTSSQNNRLQILIRDNGIGITSDQQKHIFEKFYRVPTGNIHNVKGFGLGLNYVYYVVSAHQGIITVQSELGEGSSFNIDLPLTYDH